MPTSLPNPLPESLAKLIAERFRVIGEPMRIRILDRLRAGEASVGELANALGTSQQNVSKHVAVLAGARIVSRRKRGTTTQCGISDPGVFDLCEQVCGSLSRQTAELQELLDGREVSR